MNTEQFFNLILPTQGYRCIAKKQEYGFAHHVLISNHEAAKRVKFLDFQCNEEVYFALGSLKQEFILRKNALGVEKKMRRVRDNIAFLKSFWLDIDCGEGKEYPDQPTALRAVVKFIQESSLPTPLIVNSGYGLHLYFPLTENIAPESWVKVANLLHHVTRSFGLLVDPKRTQDISSVLRPIGTRNRKNPNAVQNVTPLNRAYQPIDFLDFTKKLAVLVKERDIQITTYDHKKATANLNQELIGGIYQTDDKSAHQVAEQCAAIRRMRDTRGDIREPLWYDAIGVLRHTKESSQVIHEWSVGHPGYSVEATDEKIHQHVSQGYGPTTCAHIREFTEASSLCAECPHYGSITSPIQLGKEQVNPIEEMPKPIELKQEIDVFAPKDIGMFELTADGVYFKDSFEPGHKVEPETKSLIINYPFIVKTSAEDEKRGGIIELQCKHPSKGLHSFFIEKSALAEKTAFNKELLRNHITISAGKVDLMRDFAISYLQELDKTAELQVLHNTMGWKGDDNFILGAHCFQKGKQLESSALDVHLDGTYCQAIAPKGSLEAWVQATEILGKPGMERHALSLLWGFAAPLMRFTGFAGAFVNIVGRSNAGKTTMLTWMTSIYGEYSALKAQKEDTYNSLMSRLGTLNNLPLALDELTNIDYKEVSDLVHSISQGREKARLNKAAADVKPRTWNTLAVSTSNSSMTDKLLTAKDDPEAERLRLIEYTLPNIPEFEGRAKEVHNILKGNYGVVGQYYAQYLVDHADDIKIVIGKIQTQLEERAQAKGKERFWMAAIAAAITGGYIASKLQLIRFEMGPVYDQAVNVIRDMRSELHETRVDFTAVLGRYLNSHIQNTIFVQYGTYRGKQAIEAVYEPMREMYVRIEHIDGGKRIYADKQHIVRWLQKSHTSSSEFVRDLQSEQVLTNINKSKILGSGWANNPNNAAIPVLEFYLEDESEIGQQLSADNMALSIV